MEKIYTTEELVEILHKERMAYCKGDRVAPVTMDLPPDADNKAVEYCGFLGAVLGAKGVMQVAGYQEVREKIQQYQVEHGISGLTISEINLGGKIVRFPEHEDQLICTDSDYQVLKVAKDRVVEAFVEYVSTHPVFLHHTVCTKLGGEFDVETNIATVLNFAKSTDWARIWESNWNELAPTFTIDLGYGDPGDAAYIYERDAEYFAFSASLCSQWTDPRTIQTVTPISMNLTETAEFFKKYREGNDHD